MRLGDISNEAFAGGPLPLDGIRVLAAELGLGPGELADLRTAGVI